jgi:hypothetical protein
VPPFHGQTGKLFAAVLKGSNVTKISADDPRLSTSWPRGNPRQPVLDRLDDLQRHLDQLIGRLSQLPCTDSASDHRSGSQPDWARSNLPALTSNVRLPLSDIVFTVSVTAYVTITTILSAAFLLR